MHPLLPRSFVVTFQRALCCSLLFLCGEPPTAQCSVLSSDLPRSCQGHPPRCVLGWLCCGREWLCPCGCHTALHVCTLAVHSQPEAPLCPPSLSSIFLVNRCVAGRFLWTLWGGLYSFSFSPCLLSRFLVCCVSMEGSSLYKLLCLNSVQPWAGFSFPCGAPPLNIYRKFMSSLDLLNKCPFLGWPLRTASKLSGLLCGTRGGLCPWLCGGYHVAGEPTPQEMSKAGSDSDWALPSSPQVHLSTQLPERS